MTVVQSTNSCQSIETRWRCAKHRWKAYFLWSVCFSVLGTVLYIYSLYNTAVAVSEIGEEEARARIIHNPEIPWSAGTIQSGGLVD